jgi:hypothetical protein
VSALPRNVPRAIELMRNVLTSTRWHQPDQLRVHVTSMASSMRDGVAQAGHSYARRLAAARLGEHWTLAEKWSGLSQIGFLQSILADEKRFDLIGGELARFASHVVVPSLSRSSIVAPDEATVASIRKLLANEMGGLVDEKSGISSLAPAALVGAAYRRRHHRRPRRRGRRLCNNLSRYHCQSTTAPSRSRRRRTLMPTMPR